MNTADAAAILRVLNEFGVDYVVIGGMAVGYRGVRLPTQDTDITPDVGDENLDRLAGALAALDARMLDPTGNPIDLPEPRIEPELMLRMRSFRTLTRHGALDVSFRPDGTDGYEDLVRRATFVVVDSVAAPVASLQDVIRSKIAAGREKDLAVIPLLEDWVEREAARSTIEIPVDPARYVDD